MNAKPSCKRIAALRQRRRTPSQSICATADKHPISQFRCRKRQSSSRQIWRNCSPANTNRQFGHSHPDAIELCGVHVSASKLTGRPRPAARKSGTRDGARIGLRELTFNARVFQAPVYARTRLPIDEAIAGPCIVEEYGATSFVPPHYMCRADAYGNLILERRR